MMATRLALFSGLLLSVFLVLAGADAATTTAATECPAAVADDPRASCGFVHLDETDSSGPVQEIFYVRLEGGPGAPVLLLPGGPGIPASADLAAWRDRLAGWRLLRTIILYDARGTGLSRPSLDCPAIRGTRDLEPGHLRACRAQLEAAGAAPATLSSRTLARDVTRLRTALGIDRWYLYGISHGTKVALLAAGHDRANVAGLVLDSLRPPWRPFYDDELSAGRRAAMAGLIAECRNAAGCRAHYPGLDTALVTLFPEGPRNAPPPQAGAVTALMSRPGTRALAPAAAVALAQGDDPALASALDMMQAPARISLGHHLALTCREDMPARGTAGRSLSYRRTYVELCATWDMDPVQPGPPTRLAGLPALILAGSWDALTPPDPGGVARHLPDAVFVPVAGAGHDVLSTSRCADDLVQRFLLAPSSVREPACTGSGSPIAPVPEPAAARRALLAIAGIAG